MNSCRFLVLNLPLQDHTCHIGWQRRRKWAIWQGNIVNSSYYLTLAQEYAQLWHQERDWLPIWAKLVFIKYMLHRNPAWFMTQYSRDKRRMVWVTSQYHCKAGASAVNPALNINHTHTQILLSYYTCSFTSTNSYIILDYKQGPSALSMGQVLKKDAFSKSSL